ncbi:MAG TPA: DAK2 domain-containing protein [Gaiellaceae bacterium]|nr:DAK2 domain-containing protein [Gaiellaceae bacterium]
MEPFELEAVRRLVRAALANLEAHRQRIDDLNVYPVPDGDTGTNLVLTLRSVVEALERSGASGSEAVARELARAALMGARGNSGVILSQIVRGFADVLGQAEEVDSHVLRRAFRAASDAAYRAVKRPVEGTMLTVIREMAEEAERKEQRSLGPLELLDAVLARGEDALARTPELLDVLRAAGVVDAGGAGLVEILRGVVLGVRGEPLPEAPVERAALGLEAIHQELSRYRYCTVFVVEGEGLDQARLERELERLGDSLLVVGDESALKIHVHTDDPGAALSLGTAVGLVEGVEIANMHRQTAEREERLLRPASAAPGPAGVPAAATGVVAVCPGEGNRRLFESLGAARVIEGGQTMNPSTAEILEAIEQTPAPEVIVLPNNANVILTAEQAAAHASKPVRVVPTRSVQAGLAALSRYVPTNSPDENERDMLEALHSVSTGEVTVASRDAELDGVEIRKGAFLGLVDGTAVASGDDLEAVARTVVERVLGGAEREWLALLTGEGAPELAGLVAAIEQAHPGVQVDVHEGGQPHYPLLVVAE